MILKVIVFLLPYCVANSFMKHANKTEVLRVIKILFSLIFLCRIVFYILTTVAFQIEVTFLPPEMINVKLFQPDVGGLLLVCIYVGGISNLMGT